MVRLLTALIWGLEMLAVMAPVAAETIDWLTVVKSDSSLK